MSWQVDLSGSKESSYISISENTDSDGKRGQEWEREEVKSLAHRWKVGIIGSARKELKIYYDSPKSSFKWSVWNTSISL